MAESDDRKRDGNDLTITSAGGIAAGGISGVVGEFDPEVLERYLAAGGKI